MRVGIEQQQEGLADDRLAAFIDVAEVAGQAQAEALDEAGVPGGVGHLVAGGIEEGNILNVFAAEGPAQEEAALPRDRLVPPQASQPADEVEEGLLLVVQVPV